MKVSVSSYSFAKYRLENKATLRDIIYKTKELGFEGIEFIEMSEDEARMARRLCDELGLTVVCYSVGADLTEVCGCKMLRHLRKQVRIAKILGAPVMRHDVCYRLSDKGLCSTWQGALKRMAPRVRAIANYAKRKGVATCTENHGYIFQAPDRVEALMKAVNNKNYHWLCDIGNFVCADADPLEGTKIASKYVVHVHAKDFYEYKEKAEGTFETAGGRIIAGTVVGQGFIPVRECLGTLKGAGYDGWVTLEYEGVEHDCLDAIRRGKAYIESLGL